MDPNTVTALIKTGATLVKLISDNAAKRYSKEGWHGLSADEKRQVVHEALDISFKDACKYKASPKTVFWQIISPGIYRESEKNYGSWLMANAWVVKEPFIPAYEKKYGIMYEDVPECSSLSLSKLYGKIKPIYAIVLIIFFAIILFLIKK